MEEPTKEDIARVRVYACNKIKNVDFKTTDIDPVIKGAFAIIEASRAQAFDTLRTISDYEFSDEVFTDMFDEIFEINRSKR